MVDEAAREKAKDGDERASEAGDHVALADDSPGSSSPVMGGDRLEEHFLRSKLLRGPHVCVALDS